MTLWAAYWLVGFGCLLGRLPIVIRHYRGKAQLRNVNVATALFGIALGLLFTAAAWPLALGLALLGAFSMPEFIVRGPPSALFIEDIDARGVAVYELEALEEEEDGGEDQTTVEAPARKQARLHVEEDEDEAGAEHLDGD